MEFELINQEYFELMKLLKFMGLTESGAHSKIVIDEGEVRVNGKTEFRRRYKCRVGDIIEFSGESIKITGEPNKNTKTQSDN